MEQHLFNNTQILAWLQYFSENTQVDLEKVKILDITRKNKNLIPTVESNDAVLVFTEAGHADIFYRMWDAGLGECDVWYNTGSDPSGPIEHNKLRDMINRGINASAAMLILNPNARSTYKIGMRNSNFSRGSIHYVGSEIRAVILKKFARRLAETKGMLDEFELFERVERLTPEALLSVKGEDKVVCANVDLFSGMVYKMMGIPQELYTPLFAVARIVGWCAHRIEEVCQPGNRIIRPAYKAVAPMRPFVPLDQR